MKRNGHITGFYLETLMLIVVFISIILVLTQIFGVARMQSTEAKELTDAVILAGNAAEAVSACGTQEELLDLLNERENAFPMTGTDGVTAYYDTKRSPDPKGSYRVDISWRPEETENGFLVSSLIEVRCGTSETPVYTLETERFHAEVGE